MNISSSVLCAILVDKYVYGILAVAVCNSMYLLLQYACQNLLGFMFRHGHYKDACLLFFPPNAVPPPPQPSSLSIVTSSSSPQRPDPLATDYGTIDDLCDLCIGYGAMPVLEEVLSTRILSAAPQDVIFNQYTAAALARICVCCELHKHFNYLYRFQVLHWNPGDVLLYMLTNLIWGPSIFVDTVK